MERDSFIFYRSFYEAIKDLPKDIRLEVFTAIMEYALYGRQPEDLKPFAKGIFTLIKPNIDVNTSKYENGKKGAQFGKLGGRPRKQSAPSQAAYTLTYEQEVEQMKSDDDWRKTVCEDFNITADEYDTRLSRFLERCNDDRERKGKDGHDSYVDCQSHLRYWMTKAYPRQEVSHTVAPKGRTDMQIQKETDKRHLQEAKKEAQQPPHTKPADWLAKNGFSPGASLSDTIIAELDSRQPDVDSDG